ncbi:MAG: hypothetical protein GX045_11725 [Clostridiaceae bacterium]|jgi:YesN/AraC family two-component response regulator|nr:hypothetical protein [Clostridiaceae bacterium]
MFNVILSDYDRNSLNILSRNFRWKEFGFNVEAMFTRGLKALEYMTFNKVDLVVTEIDMPEAWSAWFSSVINSLLRKYKNNVFY